MKIETILLVSHPLSQFDNQPYIKVINTLNDINLNDMNPIVRLL